MEMVEEIYTQQTSKEIFDKLYFSTKVILEALYKEHKDRIDPRDSIIVVHQKRKPTWNPEIGKKPVAFFLSTTDQQTIQGGIEDAQEYQALELFLDGHHGANAVCTLRWLKDTASKNRNIGISENICMTEIPILVWWNASRQ